MDKQEILDLVTSEVAKVMDSSIGIKVGVSARHIHLSQEHLEALFGKGYELTKMKDLMGREFASKETLTVISPAMRTIENVRILGPVRKNSQVEISRTDTFALKVSPPVRPSGEIEGSASIALAGPKGVVFLNDGCIIANRHIHMTPAVAAHYKLHDNAKCDVVIMGEKPTRYFDVQIRVRDDFNTEMHIDTDDANASGIRNGDKVKIVK